MPQAKVLVAPGKSREVKIVPAIRNACVTPLPSTYAPAIWPFALMSSAWVTVAPATGTSKLEHCLPEQTKPCAIGEVMPESHAPTKSPYTLMPKMDESTEPGKSTCLKEPSFHVNP